MFLLCDSAGLLFLSFFLSGRVGSLPLDHLEMEDGGEEALRLGQFMGYGGVRVTH